MEAEKRGDFNLIMEKLKNHIKVSYLSEDYAHFYQILEEIGWLKRGVIWLDVILRWYFIFSYFSDPKVKYFTL